MHTRKNGILGRLTTLFCIGTYKKICRKPDGFYSKYSQKKMLFYRKIVKTNIDFSSTEE